MRKDLSRIHTYCRQCGYREESPTVEVPQLCRTVVSEEPIAELRTESQGAPQPIGELPDVMSNDDDVRQAQRRDPQLLPVIRVLEQNADPLLANQSCAESRETRAYFVQGKNSHLAKRNTVSAMDKCPR